MANLPTKGWMTQDSILPDVRNPLELHLNHNDLKLGRKCLSYGQFTNQRLDDSSVYHEGKKGSIRASSEPKISSVGQEMAELWLIYQPKVGLLKIVSCQI